MSEAIHIRPSAGPCEVHDWPTAGLPQRLVTAMRERHGHGGLNACTDCITRAKDEAQRMSQRKGTAT